MKKQEFINLVVPGAQEGQHKYHVLPSLTLAQAILETGWGKHIVGNNLFGIKASKNYNGPKVTCRTTEYVKGKKVTIYTDFRAYASISDSVVDHAELLGTLKRYVPVLKADDYKEGCQELKKCGYATDPNYPKKLIQIIEKYKLYQYDKQ